MTIRLYIPGVLIVGASIMLLTHTAQAKPQQSPVDTQLERSIRIQKKLKRENANLKKTLENFEKEYGTRLLNLELQLERSKEGQVSTVTQVPSIEQFNSLTVELKSQRWVILGLCISMLVLLSLQIYVWFINERHKELVSINNIEEYIRKFVLTTALRLEGSRTPIEPHGPLESMESKPVPIIGAHKFTMRHDNVLYVMRGPRKPKSTTLWPDASTNDLHDYGSSILPPMPETDAAMVSLERSPSGNLIIPSEMMVTHTSKLRAAA